VTGVQTCALPISAVGVERRHQRLCGHDRPGPGPVVDVVAPPGGLDAAVEKTVAALLECAPQALRAQKDLIRQWEELPLKQSVNLSIGVFGQSFLTGEPQRLMQGFVDRKR